MKNFLKEHWRTIIPLALIIFFILIICNVSYPETITQWNDKQISKITLGDIAILILAHAYISRSECNCNDKK